MGGVGSAIRAQKRRMRMRKLEKLIGNPSSISSNSPELTRSLECAEKSSPTWKRGLQRRYSDKPLTYMKIEKHPMSTRSSARMKNMINN